MSLVTELFGKIQKTSAGSAKTSDKVAVMLKKGSVLYVGDELATTQCLISRGFKVKAAIIDDTIAEQGKTLGLDCSAVQRFELPEGATDFDILWYNGVVELDGYAHRLELLRESCKKGGTVVFRTLCWLIYPSPDTKIFCKKRFGAMEHLDTVLRLAKEAGFKIEDFYISPKADWTDGFYKPLIGAAEEYAASHGGDRNASVTVTELQKELDMFELHCEEYSYVYYILKG